MDAPKSDLEPWQWPEEQWRKIVNRVRAGRRLRPAEWPGGARCAVALSFDSDHETSDLRDGGKSIGRLAWGQFGNRVGVPRILDLLAKHGVKGSFYVPAVTALLHPDEQRRVVAEGHEIGIHGWIHELNSILPQEAERDLMRRSADTLERVIELPVEWVRDDAVYFMMNRFSALRPYTPPTDVLDIFRREFDAAYDEGGIFQLTMHPHVIGYRSRIWILDEIIRHAQSRAGVWFATHAEVVDWAKRHAA